MSTAAGISLDEYLSTHYEPECELIRGELHPKQMGTEDHATVQFRLILLLAKFEAEGSLKVRPEISVRHGDDVLFPDVAVYLRGTRLFRGILDEPPLLCIEVVSPSQHPSELFAKCETYHAWGVPFCWVIDPVRKVAWEYHSTAPLDLVTDTLRAGEIHVAVSALFE